MLLLQTHSPEVDYSLFIMETVEMSMEKKETSPVGLRRSFPPPIFSLLVSVSCFSRVAALPSKKRRGTLYLGVFRSWGCFRAKDRSKRGHEGQMGWAHTAWYRGRVGHSLSAFWPPLFSILFPNALFLQNNDPRKFSAHLDVVWVPETSKYRK